MSVCDEEPCKSTLDTFWDEMVEGSSREGAVRRACRGKKAVSDQLFRTALLWLALFAQAVACAALGLGPEWLCQLLWLLSLAALLAIGLLLIRFIVEAEDVRRRSEACEAQAAILRNAWDQVTKNCPEECWPPKLIRLECNCRE